MARLPLFPLGTVLFPGSPLPLQVFEPRYVQLLRDLAERQPRERVFGVVSLQRGNEVGADGHPVLAPTGTTARLTSIRSAQGGPTGVVLVIETVGSDRFRLESFDATDTPYYVGEVTWLEDSAADPEELARAAAEATRAYDEYVIAVGDDDDPVAGAPPARLAYQLATSAALPVSDRQAVLDEADPVRRLRLVTRLLRREALLVGGLRLAPTDRQNFAPPSRN
ncbi:peptidase [Nostocoides sp. F2B08]|uniref:LON peptidase substrate-binding domain-containing protein n=1 Tax=Nostocoides sp. F2B08 TaxID=2653936 RepID=UPI0012634A80|nr:LON peptidase substrate-binding domain-containing protein [Tetrasphaera sp. F2B08]KAB7743939.1 peptidase [Tetrasphaera sp. F2B08]